MELFIVSFGDHEERRTIGIARSLYEAREISCTHRLGFEHMSIEEYYGVSSYEAGYSHACEADCEILEGAPTP